MEGERFRDDEKLADHGEKKTSISCGCEAEKQATNFIDLIKRNLFASCIVSFYFVRDLRVCSYQGEREIIGAQFTRALKASG